MLPTTTVPESSGSGRGRGWHDHSDLLVRTSWPSPGSSCHPPAFGISGRSSAACRSRTWRPSGSGDSPLSPNRCSAPASSVVPAQPPLDGARIASPSRSSSGRHHPHRRPVSAWQAGSVAGRTAADALTTITYSRTSCSSSRCQSRSGYGLVVARRLLLVFIAIGLVGWVTVAQSPWRICALEGEVRRPRRRSASAVQDRDPICSRAGWADRRRHH
jgi:hypothetical protein